MYFMGGLPSFIWYNLVRVKDSLMAKLTIYPEVSNHEIVGLLSGAVLHSQS